MSGSSQSPDSTNLRDQLILAALPIVSAREETIGDISRVLGIQVEDYKPKLHWPMYLAKECCKFADIFIKAKEHHDKIQRF